MRAVSEQRVNEAPPGIDFAAIRASSREVLIERNIELSLELVKLRAARMQEARPGRCEHQWQHRCGKCGEPSEIDGCTETERSAALAAFCKISELTEHDSPIDQVAQEAIACLLHEERPSEAQKKCGAPTPDGPCTRDANHLSETHWHIGPSEASPEPPWREAYLGLLEKVRDAVDYHEEKIHPMPQTRMDNPLPRSEIEIERDGYKAAWEDLAAELKRRDENRAKNNLRREENYRERKLRRAKAKAEKKAQWKTLEGQRDAARRLIAEACNGDCRCVCCERTRDIFMPLEPRTETASPKETGNG